MRQIARGVACVLAVALVILPAARTQEREDRTLLSWEQLRAIINEASGERAMHHVLELVPYPRIRDRAEYAGKFSRIAVMGKFAKEYGFSNVEIESFPAARRIVVRVAGRAVDDGAGVAEDLRHL